MKYCNDYAALLDLFVDGELTPAEMADVQAHLDTCPGCRAYVDDALAVRAAFPDVEETVVPEGFAEGVMAAVAASAAKSVKKKQKNRWMQVAMPLAACLAVVIVLRNGPVADRGMGGMGAAPAAAAPAMAETTAEAVAITEESKTMAPAPTAMMDEAEPELAMSAPPAATVMTKMAAPEAGAETEAILYSMAFKLRVEIPAEAGRFLEGFSAVEETDTELHYHLSLAEFETLLEQMAHANLSPLTEESVAPDTEQVLVVLKK